LTAPDPSSLAFVFPGQGSQTVGMGRSCVDAFAESAAVFEAADRALGFDLSTLCWDGPEEDLQLTVNTQPAILTVSIAVHRALEAQGLEPRVVAGHSLGEYSALVAAGSLAFEDAIRLVRTRGQLMQEAVPVGVGAMAAIIGLPSAELQAIVEAVGSQDSVCAVANLNAPGQTVIAGHRQAVEEAADAAKAAGAKRALILPVSAPFHSPLMRPAREAMESHLRDAEIRDPRIPVVTNADAAPATTARQVRDALLRQIDQPVRWVESVTAMLSGFGIDRFVEVGPGRVLSGLIRRIAKDVDIEGVETWSLSEPDGVAKFLEECSV